MQDSFVAVYRRMRRSDGDRLDECPRLPAPDRGEPCSVGAAAPQGRCTAPGRGADRCSGGRRPPAARRTTSPGDRRPGPAPPATARGTRAASLPRPLREGDRRDAADQFRSGQEPCLAWGSRPASKPVPAPRGEPMSTPPSNDSDLRSLFEDAVSDVHPEGGTSEIRARAGRPSASRWVPLTVAAAVATAVVIVGGAWLAQREPNDPPAAGPGTTSRRPPASRRRTLGERSRSPSTTWAARPPGRASSPRPTRSPTRPRASCRWRSRRHSGAIRSTPTTAPPSATRHRLPAHPPTERRSRSICRTTSARTWTCRMRAARLVSRRWSGRPRRPPRASYRCASRSTASRPTGCTTSTPPHRCSGPAPTRSSPPVSIATPTEGAVVPDSLRGHRSGCDLRGQRRLELKRGDEVVRNGFTTAASAAPSRRTRSR